MTDAPSGSHLCEVALGTRVVGAGRPCLIVAEAGVNHNGDLTTALKMIAVAGAAGVDAVKFQTFRARHLASATAPKARYQLETTESGVSQLAMLEALELSATDHEVLRSACEDAGVLFLSSPFDESSAALLHELDVSAFKIPSGEITNLPFLTYLAALGRPLILSTGMSYLSEVDDALRTIAEAGDPPVALLHCTSSYPAPPAEVNLRVMETLRIAFGRPIGLSDHTPGIYIAIAAVALGATIIEKHFTLDRTQRGPDHQASVEPEELAQMVEGIRLAELALGTPIKAPTPAELDTREVARKSLAAARALLPGTVLHREHLTSLRPGTGIAPRDLARLLGRRLSRPVEAGRLLSWDDLA